LLKILINILQSIKKVSLSLATALIPIDEEERNYRDFVITLPEN